VLSRDGLRSAVPDEDQVEVELNAGENRLLLKLAADGRARGVLRAGAGAGAVLARRMEIGPSIVALEPAGFTLKTDVGAERGDAEPVKVEVVAPGGRVAFTTTAPRGAERKIDAWAWPDGPYEARCSTRTFDGRPYVVHLALVQGREPRQGP